LDPLIEGRIALPEQQMRKLRMLDIRFDRSDYVRPFILTPVFAPARHFLGKREDVFCYVESLGAELHEWLLALFVDGEIGLLGVDTVATGNATGVDLDLPRIFRIALALGAKGFILVHNHPSGDPRPSQADFRAARMAKDAGEAMGIHLLEHFIVTAEGMRGICWDLGEEVFTFGPDRDDNPHHEGVDEWKPDEICRDVGSAPDHSGKKRGRESIPRTPLAR
jgi:hypothetical protein